MRIAIALLVVALAASTAVAGWRLHVVEAQLAAQRATLDCVRVRRLDSAAIGGVPSPVWLLTWSCDVPIAAESIQQIVEPAQEENR